MSITVQRCFHPVGQGVFYTEHFRVSKKKMFNVVYDCGSETSTLQIKRIINNTFSKNEEIEFLFISHFHYDHISGIEYLLERCRVKYVFLPLISNDVKFLLLIENALESGRNTFVEQLIIDPEGTIRSHGYKAGDYHSPIVIFVPPGANEPQLPPGSISLKTRKVLE
jgi:glyoxylase-like metal-dependent hydrolase (beta-lactamase superfamily II)